MHDGRKQLFEGRAAVAPRIDAAVLRILRSHDARMTRGTRPLSWYDSVMACVYALSGRGWDAELVTICQRRIAELQRRERWPNRDQYLRWEKALLAKLEHASGPASGGGASDAP
jgi:hypothetical protein